MKLSVIVPVYNEEDTIETILRLLVKNPLVSEVVVMNDGSTDGTLKSIEKVKSKKIQLISQENGGKGNAVRNGLRQVHGDYVLIQDADLEYHPDDIQELCDPIMKRENVQVVYGSRFLGPHSNLLFWHAVGNRFINLVTNVLYDTTLSDLETCYKLMPTQLMKDLDLKSNGFELEPEITCKILKRGIRIYEVPISYVGRDFSEGKKITWWDGLRALGEVIKYRFI